VIPVDTIRTRVKGRVIEPIDRDYNNRVAGGIDRLPSLIVLLADTTDAGAAIGLARQNASSWRCAAEATARPLPGHGRPASSSPLRDLPEIASATKAALKGR
jgi:hypothetical protein